MKRLSTPFICLQIVILITVLGCQQEPEPEPECTLETGVWHFKVKVENQTDSLIYGEVLYHYLLPGAVDRGSTQFDAPPSTTIVDSFVTAYNIPHNCSTFRKGGGGGKWVPNTWQREKYNNIEIFDVGSQAVYYYYPPWPFDSLYWKSIEQLHYIIRYKD